MKRGIPILFALACGAAALAPLGSATHSVFAVADGFPGWPTAFEGKALTALPLTAVEQRFQASFPGHVGRFTDGEREIIMRWVAQGTRKLHASGDCFKANGYVLTPVPVAQLGAERWSAFKATKGGATLAVRERIVDSKGGQWSDVSSWYWAVQLGQTTGPWWAITVAENPRP